MQVDTLGRYRIDKELGRGAMGRVFLAYDPQIERRVAIKTIQIFASLPGNERNEARERFLREARAAGKLLHPGIVTVFDVGEADGVPYLAMEYVEGNTLDAFCRPEALLPVPTVVAIVAAAADALGFAHASGIVHRDIKPSNLMKYGDAGVKVMDFGLAKSSASMTHDGSLLGTPNYMSPEQIRGDALDGRSDLFSLGVVLYEMLTGEKPFAGDSISSVLYRIVHEPPRQAELHLERVPAALASFLSRALSKNPGDRFPDGGAFARALRRSGEAARTEAAEAREAPAPHDAKAPRRREPRERSASSGRWPWIGGAVIVLAAVAAVATRIPAWLGPPAAPMIQATVRTEPPGAAVSLNGAPLQGSTVSFPLNGPFGVLTTSQGCREAKHRLEAADAGREIVLAFDPVSADVAIDAGVSGAQVTVNGKTAGVAPMSVALDLCRENTIEAAADAYRPIRVVIPAKATPLTARTAAAAMKLELMPLGQLRLPAARVPLTFTVDGKEVARGAATLSLPAGRHAVRAFNKEHFVDIETAVDVPEGGEAAAKIDVPALARLVVQTFPPNCRVAIRCCGSTWRTVGDSPLRHDVAPGRYDVRVESPLDGTVRERAIDIRAGANPPVRISFGQPER